MDAVLGMGEGSEGASQHIVVTPSDRVELELT